MNIDQYISELLFEYDCVIVPDFGGFVTNYASARIHPTQHLFSAPSKHIGFNKNLKNNDGLLANHITVIENTTYAQANKIISSYVDKCNRELKGGKKVSIKNVGVLSLNVEHQIQFEPDENFNYLTDSFGFSDFQSPAIKRENYTARIESQFKDRVAIPAIRKKINVKKYVALAIAMPLVFTMLWVPLKTDLLKNINYSDSNPFAKVIKTELSVNPENTSMKMERIQRQDTVSLNTSTPVSKADTLSGRVDASKEILKEEVLPEKQVSTAVIKEKVSNSINGRYHVVGGCFKIIENAQRLVLELRGKNVDASIIGQNNAGLYIVSYGDYEKRGEAVQELARIKAGDNASAWLLKK